MKHNSIAYILGCVVDNMADYVSYVYSTSMMRLLANASWPRQS